MLRIETFDARAGGNVIYKALAHPLAAEGIGRLYARLAEAGPVAIYDPDGIAEALLAMYPDLPGLTTLFVHDVIVVGRQRAGMVARALTELPQAEVRTVLIAAFDADRAAARISHLLPAGAGVASLDEVKLPAEILTVPRRYLDKLNFATNFVFFREQDGLSTRLVSANYWAGYGAGGVRLWLRLFGVDGAALATWEQDVPAGPSGFAIDSREVRERFGLPEFTGQLFLHVVGAAGHDVVKYALDTFGGASVSCTHDANAWPADRYAGLPAPRADERVILWLQNSHAAPIPEGAVMLDRMGAEQPTAVPVSVRPFATVAVDVEAVLPRVRWPAQIEIRAGRHVVRPRYEVVRAGRTRIAHVNVERGDLLPDTGIPLLPRQLGRGYLLPFPVLDPARFRSIVQPNPMAVSQMTLPVRLDVFDALGRKVAERFLGCLRRNHAVTVDVSEIPGVAEGHAELVYDFRDGGEADGWLHGLFRYEQRQSGHAAECSFGSHIFNTIMTYQDEPQSYSGPPPGLSTRLFLKLGDGVRRSFSVLIYPASADWHEQSATTLVLHDGTGRVLGERAVSIACRGSVMVWPDVEFGSKLIGQAGPEGYVLVRDTTCRLFGYHGLMDESGGFSLDHMFGF